MTIKPFYIKTDGLKGGDIAFSIGLCVKYGASACEGAFEFNDESAFRRLFSHEDYKFFGVDSKNNTMFHDDPCDFGRFAIEITMDTLLSHLGIEQEDATEYKSLSEGDDCIFDNKSCREFGDLTLEYINKKAVIHHLFINSNSLKMALIEFDDGYCCAVVQDCLSKPETPQQREKRENLKLAYELYSFLCESKNKRPKNFDNFKSVNHGADAAAWVELVKLTNYRETKNGKE